MNLKETCLCEDCINEIKGLAKELSPEQLAVAKACGMTSEQYAEYM